MRVIAASVNWQQIAGISAVAGVITAIITGVILLTFTRLRDRGDIAERTETHTQNVADRVAEVVQTSFTQRDRRFDAIEKHLLSQDARLRSQGERLARIEGKLDARTGDT